MLAKVNRSVLFDSLKEILDVNQWTGQQVKGLDRLLDGFERDPLIPDSRVGVQRVAYWLYTDWHETGHTFTPVVERGGRAYYIRMYGGHTAKGKRLGNDTPEEGADYAGKGDVQLTGENNYEAAEEMIRENYPLLVEEFERRTGKKFDLTVGDQPNDKDDPKNALDPQISLAILVAGTTMGMFGPAISNFINANKCDYRNARRSVNVLDKAERWEKYCPKIERAILKAQAEYGSNVIQPLADSLPETKVTVDSTSVTVDTGTPAGAQPPVPGGGPDDPAVKANKQSLITKITGWAGGSTVVTMITDKIGLLTGLSPEAQVWVLRGLLVFGVLGALIAAADHFQTKYTRSRRDLLNTK